jgi:hypothetical protein
MIYLKHILRNSIRRSNYIPIKSSFHSKTFGICKFNVSKPKPIKKNIVVNHFSSNSNVNHQDQEINSSSNKIMKLSPGLALSGAVGSVAFLTSSFLTNGIVAPVPVTIIYVFIVLLSLF